MINETISKSLVIENRIFLGIGELSLLLFIIGIYKVIIVKNMMTIDIIYI